MRNKPPPKNTGTALRAMLITAITNLSSLRTFPTNIRVLRDTRTNDVFRELNCGEHVTYEDMRTLANNCWLNCAVINFYANLLIEEQALSELPGRCAIFDSTFISKLLREKHLNQAKLFRWFFNTLYRCGVNFAGPLILIFPVNVEKDHWYMVDAELRVSVPGSLIISVSDSLFGDFLEHQKQVSTCLREFLTAYTAKTPVSQPENKLDPENRLAWNLVGDCDLKANLMNGAGRFIEGSSSIQRLTNGTSAPDLMPAINPVWMRELVINHMKEHADPTVINMINQLYSAETGCAVQPENFHAYLDSRLLRENWWDHVELHGTCRQLGIAAVVYSYETREICCIVNPENHLGKPIFLMRKASPGGEHYDLMIPIDQAYVEELEVVQRLTHIQPIAVRLMYGPDEILCAYLPMYGDGHCLPAALHTCLLAYCADWQRGGK